MSGSVLVRVDRLNADQRRIVRALIACREAAKARATTSAPAPLAEELPATAAADRAATAREAA